MIDTDFEKPVLDLLSIDGNAFSIIGAVRKALSRAGAPPEYVSAIVEEMMSGSYDNLLQIAMRETVMPDED